MINTPLPFFKLTKILLGYLAIGLCGYALGLLGNIDLHIELAFAVALTLVSKGRVIYVCVLGSLILSWMLGVFNDVDILTNAARSLWSALGTLVLCKMSPYAIRTFLGTRWRSLLELKDFLILLVLGGLFSSLIAAAFEVSGNAFLFSVESLGDSFLAILTKWLEIAIGACIFLPIFLSLILRNTSPWNGRSKGFAFWGLILIMAGSFFTLTDRDFSVLITRAFITQEFVKPTKKVASKVAEIEGVIIGFNQIPEIVKTSTPALLLQLSQRIFSQYPSLRSLTLNIDAETLSRLRNTTTTDQESKDYFVTDVFGYQLLQINNPKYPNTLIDPATISHYLELENQALPGGMKQDLQSFNLIKHDKDSAIIVYGPLSFDDMQGLHPNESVKRNNLTYADIDIDQLLSSDMQMDTIKLGTPWSRLQLQINVSPNKNTLWNFSLHHLNNRNSMIEIASLKLFNQNLLIEGSLSPEWIEKNTWQTLIPIKILKLFITFFYMICVFVIATRQMRFRSIITKQGLALDQQYQRLTLFQKSIQNAQEAIAILKLQREGLHIEYVNEAFCKMAGLPTSEIIGTVWSAYVDYPVNDNALSHLRQSIAKGVSSRQELMLINELSEWRWVELTLTPIGADDSATTHWLLLQQDISERKRIDLELKRSELEARNLSATKSRFLVNMSHEIRTPLSGIIGLSNLAQEAHDPDIIRQYLNTIKKSANHQLEIITSILNALKIEANQIHPVSRHIDLGALLDETIAILQPNALVKNIALNVNLSKNLPIYIEIDPLLLKQIILNLVANAIKFTHQGQINVNIDYLTSNEQSIGLRFSIADSGIGLGSLSLKKITQPFFKGELDSNTDGLGLGLAIVESYLQQMNSHLQVQSRNHFGGATFYFDLNCEYAQHDQEITVQHDVQTPSLSPSATNDLFVGLSFLLIEDNLINQIVMLDYLKDSGAAIDIATTGMSAMAKITSTEYDLILLDLRIPSFDTATIAPHLKNVHKDSGASVSTPIVGISASQQDDYDATLKRYGLNDFLTKPVDQAHLFAVIKKHVFSNTLEVEAASATSTPVTSPDKRNSILVELKQLFLEQALFLRPTFDQYFYPNANNELLDALHLVQGSAAALALFDLQQAAQTLENSIRTRSNHVGSYLNFLHLYDEQIKFFRQFLTATNHQASQATTPKYITQSNHPIRHFNILLVDDNVLVSKVLGSQIEAEGLSIDFAYSSEEALLKLDTHRYDIVVTDLILPDIDGLALTKIITAQPRFKDKIIFGLSAYSSDTIDQGCKEAGMKHLYSKLSDPSVLLATLVETVNSLNSEQR